MFRLIIFSGTINCESKKVAFDLNETKKLVISLYTLKHESLKVAFKLKMWIFVI